MTAKANLIQTERPRAVGAASGEKRPIITDLTIFRINTYESVDSKQLYLPLE
jgi:hypothetical protein